MASATVPEVSPKPGFGRTASTATTIPATRDELAAVGLKALDIPTRNLRGHLHVK